jgi:hypothetical protein
MRFFNGMGETQAKPVALVTDKAPSYMSDTDKYWYEEYCKKYGLPTFKNGYWFWTKATENNWQACTYFTVDKSPCNAWDPEAYSKDYTFYACQIPPYQKDIQWEAYKAKIEQPALPVSKPSKPPDPIVVPKVEPVSPEVPIKTTASTPSFFLVAVFAAVGVTAYSLTQRFR